MLTNYLKVALRSLLRHKFYSLINIFGLAIGLGACLLIYIYVKDELSFDRHHPFGERTYRINVDGSIGDQSVTATTAGAPTGPTAVVDFPEVESYVRFRSYGGHLVKYEDKHYQEEKVVYADSSLFKVFALPLVQGDPEKALAQPNVVVISAPVAQKYFGSDNCLGKQLLLDNKTTYTVTGVLAEPPGNTHFNFDFYLSMASLEESRLPLWGYMNFNTYLVLREGTDPVSFEKKMSDQFVEKYFVPEVEKYLGQSWDEFISAGNHFAYSLMPIEQIHLHSDMEGELGVNGDIKYVWIFSLIGAFILLLAGINFVNISTARSAVRAREIGVRKVVGAQRSHLVAQFIGEGVLVSLFALFLAWGTIHLILPYFNDLAGKTMTSGHIRNVPFILSALGITAITGILAGLYPALFLSGFKPVTVLKGVFHHGTKSWLRNGLVIFQFLITIFLICGTLIVQRQLQYIQNKKLGYDREHVMILHDVYAMGDRLFSFKDRITALPQVESASVSSYLPVTSSHNISSYFLGERGDQKNAALLSRWDVDHDYVKTMGIEIVAGRDFSKDFPTDSQAVLINERLAAMFGDKNPLDDYISSIEDGDEVIPYKVIGILKDFHFLSLREYVGPLVLFLRKSDGLLSIRFRTENIAGLIDQLKQVWTTMAPDQPFAYSFMDDRFKRMYEAEQRFGKIIRTFSVIAMLIACIGMIGLATFITEQRMKEIGVRKVLGASSTRLVALLSKDFLKQVFIAFLIATPVAWYVMSKWLHNFAYRINPEWWVFVMAGSAALLIAALTVSYQSIKAAVANPVDSLRSE